MLSSFLKVLQMLCQPLGTDLGSASSVHPMLLCKTGSATSVTRLLTNALLTNGEMHVAYTFSSSQWQEIEIRVGFVGERKLWLGS